VARSPATADPDPLQAEENPSPLRIRLSPARWIWRLEQPVVIQECVKVDCEEEQMKKQHVAERTALAGFSAREAAMFFIWMQLT
jgi:hypothetical protein